MYNNHAYNVAGLVVEKVSGISWSDFVTTEIFNPLGMKRSYTYQPDDKNVAFPYNILTDRSPYRIPFCNVSNKTMMFAGQSVRTSMSDLLSYSKAYLEALATLSPENGRTSPISKPFLGRTKEGFATFFAAHLNPLRLLHHLGPSTSEYDPLVSNPIRQISTIIRPQVPRPVDSLLEQTYALGWNRTQLPGSLDFGWNSQVISHFPILGEHYPGKLAIWHGGNMPGTTAAICLLPEDGTAVVVLQNSLGLCDVADWVCQLTLDTLMVGHPTQDYLGLTKASVSVGIKRMDKVEEQLLAERIPGTQPSPLETYTGRFYNKINNWFIDILVEDGQLYLEFLGKADERFALRHYHYHTFAWNLSYDETVKRAQYVRSYEYYRLEFEPDRNGKVEQLRWRHDKTVPDGELFYKSQAKAL
jgi:hypothetical protein